MEQKNLTENFSPYALALYNYKLFEGLKRLAENPGAEVTDISNSKELFELIENSFADFHNKENLSSLLPILHYTIRFESKVSSRQVYVAEFLLKLLCKYKHSEPDQKLVLQIFYQLLKSFRSDDQPDWLIKTDELFHIMCDLLFTCGDPLASNIITCLQLQISKFQGQHLLQLLWQAVVENNKNKNLSHRLAQILVNLIDDLLQFVQNFYRNENFIEVLQVLLVSAAREERKAAVYLLRKVVPFIINHAKAVPSWEVDNSAVLNYSWYSYITVLENLEEKQSHLILPTLTTIKKITLHKVWLDLLYKQLLQHNNCLVVRWTIDHMLDNFKCIDLNQMLLKGFLEAVNSTSFYNSDNYCISAAKLKKFLNCDLMSFLNTLADINWKPVPLLFWFKHLDLGETNTNAITKETLLKISSRVRVLQNRIIRRCVIKYFEEVFNMIIENLNIEEYLKLIESLYNTSDGYEGYTTLIIKLSANKTELRDDIFTQRLYEIVHVRVRSELHIQKSLLRIFQNVPTEKHGWFRFMFVFDFERNAEKIDFCRSKYNIHLYLINGLRSFNSRLIKMLLCKKDEESFVRKKAMDYFVLDCLKSYNEILSYRPSDLLNRGGEGTIVGLSQLLTSYNDLIDLNIIIDCLLEHVEKYNKNTELCSLVYKNLFNYFYRLSGLLSEDILTAYTTKILKTDRSYISYEALFLSKLEYKNIEQVVNALFCNETLHGDARIEKKYELEIHSGADICYKLRFMAIDYLKKYHLDLLKYLIKMNADISEKKPRYFENSHEHRIKLRITIAVLQILQNLESKYWSDDYWQVILEQNNQLNITYFFERIIAYCAPSADVVLSYLKAISKYSASQQVSIIVVCCIYFCINWSAIENSVKNVVIDMLLPLTMGANFQIRLYSQLTIYKILKKFEENDLGYTYFGIFGASSNNRNDLKEAITLTLGHRLEELLSDIRLDVDAESILNYEEILFVTNAPFEEAIISETTKERFAQCKEQFCKKFKSDVQQNEEENNTKLTPLNGQRKINPLTDIKPNNDLISYPECQTQRIKDKNVIVVASLIDKLPNLGGVARTCEVLGIKNLIIHSKKYIFNDEFKNLSMTAEKGLIINEVKQESLLEFLVQKQIEGYEIVGAEQTANSRSFVDFKFPKRCIILLGHEKEGIPANLLSILDHTVEIPQYGIVRSLNVHVTGALFMWEYCKQHIVEI